MSGGNVWARSTKQIPILLAAIFVFCFAIDPPIDAFAGDDQQTSSIRFSLSGQYFASFGVSSKITIPITFRNKLADNATHNAITIRYYEYYWQLSEWTSFAPLPIGGTIEFAGDNKPTKLKVGTEYYIELSSAGLSGTIVLL